MHVYSEVEFNGASHQEINQGIPEIEFSGAYYQESVHRICSLCVL